MKYTIAFIAATQAVKMNKAPVWSGQPHWNEDPHSIPTPLSGTPYLTSTQARFISENSTANMESREPHGDLGWHFNLDAYNKDDTEYDNERHFSAREHWLEQRTYAQLEDEVEDDSLVLTSSLTGATWRVIADFGEKDDNIMDREFDIKNGEKFSGWTNPLAWTDDGNDDNLVV